MKFVSTEIDFNWWHREACTTRSSIMTGDVKVRPAPELLPKREHLGIYKEWFAFGLVPDEIWEPEEIWEWGVKKY